MTISHKPDWITAWPNAETQANLIPDLVEMGFRLRPTAGRMSLISSGSDCETSQVRFCLLNKIHISRFDIALDIKSEIDFARARSIFAQSGRWSTNEEGKRFETLYLGSRKSARFFRIYDKAAEQAVAGEWWRIEGEFKQRAAEQYAWSYLTSADWAVNDILTRTRAEFFVSRETLGQVVDDPILIPRPPRPPALESVKRYRKIIGEAVREDKAGFLALVDAWGK